MENSFCTVIHVSPFIISSLNGWVIVPNLNLWPSKIFCQKLFELARENNKVEWLLSVYSVDIRHISDCLLLPIRAFLLSLKYYRNLIVFTWCQSYVMFWHGCNWQRKKKWGNIKFVSAQHWSQELTVWLSNM